MGMIEIGQELAFQTEATQDIGAGEAMPDQLDGDGHGQLVILAIGQVNGTHTAARQLAIEAIGSDTQIRQFIGLGIGC